MVWNDTMIRAWTSSGGSDSFDTECINPASLDLRLGNKIRRVDPIWEVLDKDQIKRMQRDDVFQHVPRWDTAIEFSSYWLQPGEFVLCHSAETITMPDNAVAILASKSSMGRIGLEHLHAGYVDPKFSGQLTWEFHNVAPWPIELIPGTRLMQLVIMSMTGSAEKGYDLTGRYQHQTGPTPAR